MVGSLLNLPRKHGLKPTHLLESGWLDPHLIVCPERFLLNPERQKLKQCQGLRRGSLQSHPAHHRVLLQQRDGPGVLETEERANTTSVPLIDSIGQGTSLYYGLTRISSDPVRKLGWVGNIPNRQIRAGTRSQHSPLTGHPKNLGSITGHPV